MLGRKGLKPARSEKMKTEEHNEIMNMWKDTTINNPSISRSNCVCTVGRTYIKKWLKEIAAETEMKKPKERRQL